LKRHSCILKLKKRNSHTFDPFFPLRLYYLPTHHFLSSTRLLVCTFQESEIGGKGRDRCFPKHYVQRPVISLSHPYSLKNPRSYSFSTLVVERAILQNLNNSTSVILESFFAIAILYPLIVQDCGDAANYLILSLPINSSLYQVLLFEICSPHLKSILVSTI